MNKYLIAYIAPNDRVMATEIFADDQTEVIAYFGMSNPCCTILAITLLEERAYQHEDEGESQ